MIEIHDKTTDSFENEKKKFLINSKASVSSSSTITQTIHFFSSTNYNVFDVFERTYLRKDIPQRHSRDSINLFSHQIFLNTVRKQDFPLIPELSFLSF